MYFLFIYFGFVSSDNFCISTQTASTLFASPCPANAVKFQVVKNGLQNWTGGTVWCGRFKHKLLSTLWKTSTPFDMQVETPRGVMAIKLQNKNSLSVQPQNATQFKAHN